MRSFRSRCVIHPTRAIHPIVGSSLCRALYPFEHRYPVPRLWIRPPFQRRAVRHDVFLNALFCVALLAAIALSFVSAGLAMTRAATYRAAATYVAGAYQIANRTLERELSSDMQNGGLPSPLPVISPLPLACADPACRFMTGENITYTIIAPATPAASCDQSSTNCAQNEETNGYVTEGRVTAHIAVSVTDAQKNPLLTRAEDVTLRTFRAPPYVAAADARDGTFDDVTAQAAQGDDGGLPPATPNPCATPVAGTSDDTAVRVAYENTQTSACTNGSTFGSSSYSQSSNAAPGWSP